jgi:branched-chain amino acid transport system permease protein
MTGGTLASKIRGFLLGAGAFAGLLVVSQMLPGGRGSSGTPPAIIFLGLVGGLITALIAAGIVLIYRSARIINFAQAAIGAAGGAFTYELAVAETTTWPFIPAFVVGVIVAGFVGVIVELAFVRRFFNAPRLVLTVLTIALIQGLGFATGGIRNLPIFGEASERTIAQQQGTIEPNLPFGDFEFQLGELGIPFGFGHLFTIGAAIVVLIALAAFLRFTKAGTAIRAASENSDRAALLGINVKGLSTLVWGITGAISGVAVISIGLISGFGGLQGGTQGGAQAAAAVVVALAAAVIAKMRYLSVAVVAAVGLEIARQATAWSFSEYVTLFDTGLFLIILVGLLLQRRGLTRSETGDVSSWEATQEVRPTPKEILEVPGVRAWRIVLIILGIVFVLLFPWVTSTGPTNIAGYVAIQGIVLLSLVVLTGWAGQVSLGQWALVGVGGLVGGAMTAKMNLSFWLAMPAAAVVVGILALLIGLPALRIRGLYLAVTTFAMAFAVQTNVFNDKFFGWARADEVARPSFFLIDFDEERSMYYLAVGALVLCVLIVTGLRRTRPGRVLIGLRENEQNLEAFGINLVRARLSAFVIAGALCGFAGVLLVHHQRAVSTNLFPASDSLQIFIYAIIGGIGSVAGALLGVGYLTMDRILGTNPLAQFIIGPVGVLLILYAAPGGLSSIAFGIRDGIYRIIAQRKRIVVPSLFADVDPEAVLRQRAPLAEPIPGAGLAVIPAAQRYRSASWLYGRAGKVDGASRLASAEAAAMGAAAGRAEEIGAVAEEPAARATGGVAETAAEIAGVSTKGSEE